MGEGSGEGDTNGDGDATDFTNSDEAGPPTVAGIGPRRGVMISQNDILLISQSGTPSSQLHLAVVLTSTATATLFIFRATIGQCLALMPWQPCSTSTRLESHASRAQQICFVRGTTPKTHTCHVFSRPQTQTFGKITAGPSMPQ